MRRPAVRLARPPQCLPARTAGTALALSFVASCLPSREVPDLTGLDVQLTFLHTSDIHSRIFPYDMVPQYTDEQLGLMPGMGPYGGAARMATILERQRTLSGRTLHLDTGDCFQGAPVYNLWAGEAEIRALSQMGVDAVVAGNHEFDRGAQVYAEQLERWSNFPTLAANYDFADARDPWNNRLEHLIQPTAIFHIDGLRVGVVGMGNLSSLTSIDEADNSMDVRPLPTLETVQAYVDLIEPQVDVVVVITHLSLDDDVEIARSIRGVDVVLGGHLHVALDPVKVIDSIAEPGKRVVVSHAGAFAKYVQRVDLVVRDGEVLAHDNTLIPIDASIPENAAMVELLEPYDWRMRNALPLDRVVATTRERLLRFGPDGGDSPLGNLVAEAMQYRPGVETDFALTNSLGVRTDVQGPDDGEDLHVVTVEELYNVLPFDNTIATMYLSGAEVQALFDYVSARSAERGCNSQAQIASARFVMDCATGLAESVTIGGSWASCDSDADCEDPTEICVGGQCGRGILPSESYELATNNYIAQGGSGFQVLENNTTQYDTGISMRDAVEAFMLDRGQSGDIPLNDRWPEGDGRITPRY